MSGFVLKPDMTLPAIAEGAKLLIKENRSLKKHLLDLTVCVRRALDALDTVMKAPESKERGKTVAKIANWLDVCNDQARYFGLRVDYRTDKKKKLSTKRIHQHRIYAKRAQRPGPGPEQKLASD